MAKVLHFAEFRGTYTAAVPMKRHGRFADIVPPLASDRATCSTGAAILADRGFMTAGALG